MEPIMYVLFAVIILAVVALALLLFRLVRTVGLANETLNTMKEQLGPTLDNMQTITTDIKPAVRKIDPLMDRVQLTVDAMNLEMMRVDGILEDVSQITGTASSATEAVDAIASAPVKAVSGVASKVREHFGSKHASDESAQLAEQRAAVAQALADYKAAEEKEAKAAAQSEAEVAAPAAAAAAAAEAAVAAAAEAVAAAPEPAAAPVHSSDNPSPEGYQVIDPAALENSPFFDETDESE